MGGCRLRRNMALAFGLLFHTQETANLIWALKTGRCPHKAANLGFVLIYAREHGCAPSGALAERLSMRGKTATPRSASLPYARKDMLSKRRIIKASDPGSAPRGQRNCFCSRQFGPRSFAESEAIPRPASHSLLPWAEAEARASCSGMVFLIHTFRGIPDEQDAKRLDNELDIQHEGIALNV